MSDKTAVVVLSDPATGTDEAVGRGSTALATAWEYDHTAVRKQVAMVASGGCATVFGATDGLADERIEQVGRNQAPGTPGVASVREPEHSGYRVLVF